MDISILEIRNAKCLMIDREWLAGIMPTAELILSGQLHTDKMEKKLQARVTMAESGNTFLMSDGGDNENHGTQVQSEEAYLNIIFIEGLVTRNGGACTYGSKQMRNLIMSASDDDDCKGHVLIFDTPGGLSTAVPDFKMAIDYAHERGLLVDGIIDGSCASAGIYIGAMCDHLYYTSPTDRIGSVGTFAILDVMKNGDVDPSTGEKHYEIYDPESYDKNDWYRQLSEEGKQDLIIEDLKRDGKEFRDFIKSRRPKAEDSMLHGKVFKCKDVDGILVDGQRTMQEVFQEVMGHYYTTHKQNGNMQAAKENILSTQLNNEQMKEKFPALFAALAVEEMQMSEEGAFLNMGLLETLNAQIEAKNQEAADAKALADQLTAEKDALTQQVADLTAQMETAKADHEKALNDANEAHAAAIEEKDNAISALEQERADLVADQTAKAEQIETLNGQLTEKQTAIDTANATIAERDQQISDLNAQVEELTNDAGAGDQAGSPANNGAGAEQTTVGVSQYVFNPELSYDENCRREAEWNKEHGK